MHEANEKKKKQTCICIYGSFEKKHLVIEVIHEAEENSRRHAYTFMDRMKQL